MPRKVNLDRPTPAQRKRKGRYLESQRAKNPHRRSGKQPKSL